MSTIAALLGVGLGGCRLDLKSIMICGCGCGMLVCGGDDDA